MLSQFCLTLSKEAIVYIVFQSPVVHLTNLTADTVYCYSITYNESNTTVADDEAVVLLFLAMAHLSQQQTLQQLQSHCPQPQVSHHTR